MTRPDPSTGDGSGYEKRDVHTRGVYIYGTLLLVLTVLSMAFIHWFFDTLNDRATAAQVPPAAALRLAPDAAPAAPGFSMYPARTLAEFRRAEDTYLNSYGWVDREAGVARIPLARAMDILLEEGLPDVPPPAPQEGRTP